MLQAFLSCSQTGQGQAGMDKRKLTTDSSILQMIINLGALLKYTDLHFRAKYQNSRKKFHWP